jgi:hypothetical protein
MSNGTPAPVVIDPRTQTEVHPDVVADYVTPGPGAAFWSQTGAPGGKGGGSTPAEPNYSLSEQDTGRLWLDGKKVYQKTVQISAIPSGESSTAHGISAIEHVTEIQGAAFDGTHYFRIPHVDPMYPTYEVGVWADATNLGLRAGTGDLSAFTWIYLTMYYTCSDR